MSKRPSKAVYRRRQLLALLVLLIPVALLLRACTGGAEAPVETALTATETATTTAAPAKQAAKAETTTAEKATPSPSPTLTDCVNTAIKVSVTADAQTYVVGQPITIAMRIANIGEVDCKRDVGALVNEVYVTNVDGLLVWSSDACQKEAKPQIAIMKSKSVFGNTQVWSGLNTGQNCTQAAADAMPGKYLIYGRNDVVTSKPFAIEITQ